MSLSAVAATSSVQQRALQHHTCFLRLTGVSSAGCPLITERLIKMSGAVNREERKEKKRKEKKKERVEEINVLMSPPLPYIVLVPPTYCPRPSHGLSPPINPVNVSAR